MPRIHSRSAVGSLGLANSTIRNIRRNKGSADISLAPGKSTGRIRVLLWTKSTIATCSSCSCQELKPFGPKLGDRGARNQFDIHFPRCLLLVFVGFPYSLNTANIRQAEADLEAGELWHRSSP